MFVLIYSCSSIDAPVFAVTFIQLYFVRNLLLQSAVDLLPNCHKSGLNKNNNNFSKLFKIVKEMLK